ncbi:MAG: prefoldin subunit alpha [Nanoarchaeota archaeon]
MTKKKPTNGSMQDEMQEKIILYQMLQNHIEQIKKQAINLEREFMEIDGTLQAVETLSSGTVDHETLVPLGSGCYAGGKVTNNKKFLIDIGSGVIVNKKLLETKKFLEDRKIEREKILNELKNELEHALKKLNGVTQELQEMQK